MPVAEQANIPRLKTREFRYLQNYFYQLTGIYLPDSKRELVEGRLARRMRFYGLKQYADYIGILQQHPQGVEVQELINRLTTNETYFFREPAHFDWLKTYVQAYQKMSQTKSKLRIWSAACSTGEEAYSLAMLCAEHLKPDLWQITATDISEDALQQAKSAVYAQARIRKLPAYYMHKYCLKGVRSQVGNLRIAPEIRRQVDIQYLNLMSSYPVHWGSFQVIFLRNVMIYFDLESKRQVIEKLVRHLTPQGYLILGHSESLQGIVHPFKAIRPSIYQKCVS